MGSAYQKFSWKKLVVNDECDKHKHAEVVVVQEGFDTKFWFSCSRYPQLPGNETQ